MLSPYCNIFNTFAMSFEICRWIVEFIGCFFDGKHTVSKDSKEVT